MDTKLNSDGDVALIGDSSGGVRTIRRHPEMQIAVWQRFLDNNFHLPERHRKSDAWVVEIDQEKRAEDPADLAGSEIKNYFEKYTAEDSELSVMAVFLLIGNRWVVGNR